METIYQSCCGLDVHKETVQACVRSVDKQGRVRQEVRGFGTMTRDLKELSDWMAQWKVTHVAMESTGVYWKPIYNSLEGRFEVLLVNARHVKHVPGRKTDVADCHNGWHSFCRPTCSEGVSFRRNCSVNCAT